MNKYIISGITAVVVGLGGFIVLNSSSPDTAAPIVSTSSSEQSENEVVELEAPEEPAVDTGYIAYSEQNLASTKDSRQVIFFHAPWCSTCNAFEKEIVAQGVPEGITILKADFDNETDLKQKYEVRLQSTFVLLDADGAVERTWPFGQGLSNDISNLYDQVI
jgi:thioredoxin-related protein